MRRTKEEAEQTRQALLDAALAAFSAQGYQATRLQDVAMAAGTTRGAIYHHFQNKAGLYKTLIEEASAQGNEALQEAIGRGGSYVEVCRRILVTTFEMLASNPRYRQIVALSLYKTGISEELVELEEKRLQSAALTVQGVAAYMEQGIVSGDLRADLDPLTLARAFLAFQNGIAWFWLASGENFALGENAPAFADILLQGLVQK